MSLFNNFDKHLECFTFIFTKYKQKNKLKIHNQLKEVYETIENENENKSIFIELLEHIKN